MAKRQREWRNGRRNGRMAGMAGMAEWHMEWRNGGMVEWWEWLLEWREWLPTYYFMVHANAYVGIVQCTYFAVLLMVQKLLGGATYISPLLTKSQNKYKYRRSSRGNSTATATYVLFTVHSNHTVAHVQYMKNVTFVTGTSQAVS